LAVLLASLLLLPLHARPHERRFDAPNVVPISARLVTSGQPSAASLARLASLGFEAVIYLAPPSVHDAVRDEAQIVQRQGLKYVNIPIEFNHPTESDYASFAAERPLGSAVSCECHRKSS